MKTKKFVQSTRKPVFYHVTNKIDHVDDMRKHLRMSVDKIPNINININTLNNDMNFFSLIITEVSEKKHIRE